MKAFTREEHKNAEASSTDLSNYFLDRYALWLDRKLHGSGCRVHDSIALHMKNRTGGWQALLLHIPVKGCTTEHQQGQDVVRSGGLVCICLAICKVNSKTNCKTV